MAEPLRQISGSMIKTCASRPRPEPSEPSAAHGAAHGGQRGGSRGGPRGGLTTAPGGSRWAPFTRGQRAAPTTAHGPVLRKIRRGAIIEAMAALPPSRDIRRSPRPRSAIAAAICRQRGRLAQLVRAPALQAGGRWFEPGIAHHSKPLQPMWLQGLFMCGCEGCDASCTDRARCAPKHGVAG